MVLLFKGGMCVVWAHVSVGVFEARGLWMPCLSLPYSLVICSLTEPEDGLATSKSVPGTLLFLPFYRARVTDIHSENYAQILNSFPYAASTLAH